MSSVASAISHYGTPSLSGALLRVADEIGKGNSMVANAISRNLGVRNDVNIDLFWIGTGVCVGLIAVGIGVGYGLSRGNRGDYFTN